MPDRGAGLSGLDRLVYGTMRLDGLSEPDAVDLLEILLREGVRRFHSSDEYDSYDLFVRSLASACGRAGVDPASLRHVVKLASPHFGERHFDGDAVRDRLDRYAAALGAPSIAQVQWMARIDLKDEPARLALLREEGAAIAETASALREDGLIGEFGCFPYTIGFARAAIETGAFDVFVDYYNPFEREAEDYAALLASRNIRFLALRPFAAGRGFEEGRSVADLVAFALDHPVIDGIIAGTTVPAHFQSIKDAMSRPA